MRRIGIFGGTFDPPHLGHLVIAEWARAAAALDEVVFVPAGAPPHKRARAVTPAAHRLAMTRLAVRGHAAFSVSPIETRRQGPSFTVDTLRAYHARHADGRLFLIVGQDSLDEFRTWRDPADILAMATLLVAGRRSRTARTTVPSRARVHAGGAESPPEKRIVRLDNPGVDVSSSEMRERMRRGRSVRYLVPDAVVAYAARHRLYRRTR